jgi:hypothetical protein
MNAKPMMPKLVQIEWVDSRQPTASWQRVAHLDYLSECRCTSVGFLLRDGDTAKVLAVSVADEGDEMQATGVFVIPTAAVLSVKLLTASCSASASKPKQRPTSRGR